VINENFPTSGNKAEGRGVYPKEVLRILLSIGGVEIDHFALWHFGRPKWSKL
jgi:hypothetical protein